MLAALGIQAVGAVALFLVALFGGGWQTKMNAVLRAYAEAVKGRGGSAAE